ncbi:hypothetical protein ACWEKJ_25315 [Amycolatopsis thermoflava]
MRLPASWNHLRERARQGLDDLGVDDERPVDDWDDVLDRAWLEGARRFDASAQLQPRLDVRVIGDDVGHGSLSMQLVDELSGPLQSEVEAASPSGDKELLRLELAGISRGSAVMHLRPAALIDSGDEHLPLALSPVDAAIRNVFDVHDAMEREAPADSIILEGDLRKSFHKLAKVLQQHELAVEMTWRPLGGQRRRSRLSERGLSYASSLFEMTDHAEETTVSGYLYEQSLSGWFRLKSNPQNKRSESRLVHTEGDRLDLESLRLNQYLRARVLHTYQMDRFGQRSSERWTFLRFLDKEEQ